MIITNLEIRTTETSNLRSSVRPLELSRRRSLKKLKSTFAQILTWPSPWAWTAHNFRKVATGASKSKAHSCWDKHWRNPNLSSSGFFSTATEKIPNREFFSRSSWKDFFIWDANFFFNLLLSRLGNFIFFSLGPTLWQKRSYRFERQNHKQYKLRGKSTTRAEGEAREANLWIPAKKKSDKIQSSIKAK